MIAIEGLSVETEIPLKKVTSLQFKWCFNEHVSLQLEGVLDAQEKDTFLYRKYKNTKLLIVFKNNILFNGVIRESKIQASDGVFDIFLKGISATCMLDQKKHYEMFQDTSITYKKMMEQVIKNVSGNLICTIGDAAIKKPLLCYEETIWQYAIRMASHMESYVMPDISTGKPEFWFGVRNGNRIKDEGIDCIEIEIRKGISKKEKDRISYCLTSRESYQLGDRIFWKQDWHIIYKKEAYLERGELLFLYWAADGDTLKSKIYYQERITGLSLSGTVTKVKKEQVYVKLDIDGKKGIYPFQWYPETGTGLYAMPEPGAKVELYFMSHNESDAIAIRCKDTGDVNMNVKKLELPNETKVIMNTVGLELKKNDQLSLSDGLIDILGKRSIEICANKKIKITAKIIEVHSSSELAFVSES